MKEIVAIPDIPLFDYYDVLYKDKEYQLESEYLANILKHYLPKGKNLLELGCGTGNYSKCLCEAGFNITGLDFNERLLNIASRKGIPNFNGVLQDIRDFRLDSTFDAAFSLFHVIGYLTDNEEVISCFTSVSNHLHPGGLFVFDAWYTQAVKAQQPAVRLKKVTGDGIEITRIARPEIDDQRNLVTVNYELNIHHTEIDLRENLEESHVIRHFSIEEIEEYAAAAGFNLLRAEEFLTRRSPGDDTWGVCFILQKNG
jgi:SAM-dependent methyltransferase